MFSIRLSNRSTDNSAAFTLKRMLDNTKVKIADLSTKAAAKGMTVDQVMTRASIIQAEAANNDDMLLVSSVLDNRLRDGAAHDIPKLQCDTTSYYPYRTQADIPANLLDTFKSRFDTYTITGLPAGPICSPGSAAINAALNPTVTNYYYFCHDKNGDGKAYYAETLAQHNANLILAGLA